MEIVPTDHFGVEMMVGYTDDAGLANDKGEMIFLGEHVNDKGGDDLPWCVLSRSASEVVKP